MLYFLVYAQEVEVTGIPSISLPAVLGFFIKLFFSIAALVALYYLLSGAFQWISSGGDKEAIESARGKIQSAVIGLVLIVAVLSVAVTLEQFVFRENICFGISCEIKLPKLRGGQSPSPAGSTTPNTPGAPVPTSPAAPTDFTIPTVNPTLMIDIQ